VHNSQITGATYTISNAETYTARVTHSMLEGATVENFGTLSCVASYNGNYQPLNANCGP
jgi:hypothetical protein